MIYVLKQLTFHNFWHMQHSNFHWLDIVDIFGHNTFALATNGVVWRRAISTDITRLEYRFWQFLNLINISIVIQSFVAWLNKRSRTKMYFRHSMLIVIIYLLYGKTNIRLCSNDKTFHFHPANKQKSGDDLCSRQIQRYYIHVADRFFESEEIIYVPAKPIWKNIDYGIPTLFLCHPWNNLSILLAFVWWFQWLVPHDEHKYIHTFT